MKLNFIKVYLSLFIALFLSSCGTKNHVSSSLSEGVDWPVEAPHYQQLKNISAFQLQSLRGASEEALGNLKAAEKLDPESDYIQTNLAVLYLKRGNLEYAKKHLAAALKINPNNKDALRIHARLLTMEGNSQEAIQTYEKLLSLEGHTNLQDAISLSAIYAEQKEMERSIEVLHAYENAKGKNEVTRFYLGRIYAEENKIEESKEAYIQSLKIEPTYEPSIKALALIYEYEGEDQKAIDSFETLLKSDSESVQMRMHLVDLYTKQKNDDKALYHLDKVLMQNSENAQAWLKQGIIYYESKKYLKAESSFKKLKRHHSDKNIGAYYLGLILHQNEKYKEAVSEFSFVESDHELFIDANLMKAQAYSSQKKFVEAEKTVKKFLDQKDLSSKDRKRITLALFQILSEQKKYKQIQLLLEAELKKDEQSADYWFLLGENFDKQKNFKALERSMKRAIDINPNQVDALNYLGYTYLEKEIHLDQAETLIQRAHKISPQNPYITDSLGWLYYRKKDYEKAVQYLNEALNIKADEPIILEHLGDVYLASGKKAKAKDSYQRALKLKLEKNDRVRIESKLEAL